jgi:hypothetical protein
MVQCGRTESLFLSILPSKTIKVNSTPSGSPLVTGASK